MALKPCRECGTKVSTEAAACQQCGAKPKKPMGRLKVIALLIFGGVVLTTIFPSTPSSAPPTASGASQNSDTTKSLASASAPAKVALTADVRTRALADATKKLKKERDQIEKTTFYSSPTDGLRTQVGAYFGIADGRSPYLRMKTVYYGDRWVFYDAVKIMADDEVIYEKSFRRTDITRDNAAGDVWEVADYLADANDLRALERISSAKSVTVRFAGRDRVRDHKMTAAEKTGLKSVLAAYTELKQKL
jgi:hypothetical protein